ncbi:MAG TPA: sugar phosphate isomerase/epimerase family protein [Anaerolineae bacterium]|nr:sugar phosphate isomerase/epimerase family protein [Anaerolineae bacterium]
MTATFTLSAFGDEIAPDLEEQLQTLNALNVGRLDLRGAWGKNVLRMDDDDLEQVVKLCNAHHIQVACLGSPIGKSPITEPIEYEIGNLTRIFQVGEVVGCRRVRLFSFYPPDTSTNEHYDDYVEEAVARLAKLTEMAEREGFVLLLENEKGIVTDTLARCEAVIKAINRPALRFLWDSANFVQVGEERVVERGWPMVGEFIGYVHVKDAVLADGHVVPAGEGDGQLPLLLTHLKEAGYQGVLALEPHLKIAGHSTGFSGAEGMKIAVTALRKVMAETGCVETR